MATNSNYTYFRKFGNISVEFYRNNMQKVTDFDGGEVTSFHFEEGISHPYTGTLDLISSKPINIGRLDLLYLYVKISYQVYHIYENENDPSSDNDCDTRTVWALIKTVTNLPKINRVSPYDPNVKFYYQYQLKLESPLARLKNNNTIYKNYKIHQIIADLLSRKNNESENNVYNPLLANVDFSRIQNLPELDTSTLEIQRGQEDALTFLNRILIGYGINYIFDFDEQKGINLVFSRDQQYKNNFELDCTDNLSVAKNQSSFVYVSNNIIEKQSVHFEQAKNLAKNLKNNWLNFEADRTDTSGIKSSQIKFIYKNLCIRKLMANPKLTSQDVQDIRVQPGLHLNSNINELNSKYVVRNVITNLTTFFSNSKKNTLLLKIDCIELIDHPLYEELDDKAAGDYFEFDSKSELGSLVHQEIADLVSLDPKQTIDIIEAQACSEDGSIDISQTASYSKDTAKNNDLFYAVVTGNTFKNVIKVHTLIDSSSTTVTKIMQGQRILVLQKGGSYYLYGYVPEPLAVDDDKWEGISQDIVNFKNESSISLQNYKSNDEYIYSLLKTSPKAVESAVVYQALESNQPELHDDKYLNEYQASVEEKHKDYKTTYNAFQAALIALYNKYENGKFLKDYIDASGKAKTDAPEEVKKVITCKTAYKSSCEKLWTLAQNIVKNCHIALIKEAPKNIMAYTNPGGFSFNAADGNFEVTAKKIVLNANNIEIAASENEEVDPITNTIIDTGNITISAPNKINSKVGCASVKTEKTGVTISAGATIFGESPDKADSNKSDTLSSKFSVKTFDGISASAFSVSLKAGNSLQLKGPLGSGVTLGYGTVKVVGSEVKINTIGKREQVRNITEYSINFATDMAFSLFKAKNSAFYKVTKGMKETGFYAYDKGVGAAKTIKKFIKNRDKYKSGDKPLFDYIQALFDTIIWFIDLIFAFVKAILEKIEKDRLQRVKDASKDKKLKNADQKSKFTPWGNPSTLSTRMDQIILYYTHLKTVYSLVIASATAYRSGVSEWIEPAVSDFSINANKIQFSSQHLVLEAKEKEEDIAPAKPGVNCTLRQLLDKVYN